MHANGTYEVGRARLPPVTRAILIATGMVFVAQFMSDQVTREWMSYYFGLSRAGLAAGYLWQPVTYMFLHGGPWHILLNMLVVFMFGRELERILGRWRFLLLYLGSGVIGGLGWTLMSHRSYCIGASGGVFGLIGMYAALFPNRPITLLLFFIIPLTMRARTMALLLGGVSLVFMFGNGNVAHAAHLVGGLAGYWYGCVLLRQARGGRHRRMRRSLADVVGGALRSARRHPRLEVYWQQPSEPADDFAPTVEAIDRLLDKILAHGVGSLTPEERRILERASEELRGE